VRSSPQTLVRISGGNGDHSLGMEDTLIAGVTNLLSSYLPTPETEGSARQCGNDGLEVFGFLAFGLYLLNLVMNMKRRKRRAGAEQCGDEFVPDMEPDLVEGVLAFYTMFQGFLTAFYDEEESSCRSLAVCEAAKDATKLGNVGKTVAKAASSNAAVWINSKYGIEGIIAEAGELGSEGQDCDKLFTCKDGIEGKGVLYHMSQFLINHIL